jgi:hypothetical protein
MYQALLQSKETLREIWLDISVRNFERAPAGLKWPTFTKFTALEVLHAPIFLLEGFTGERCTIDLTDLLSPCLKTQHIFDAASNALPNLLPSLLNYINSPQSQNLTELIVAFTPHYVEGALFIILDESVKRGLQLTDDPLRSDESADPLCQRLKELQRACRRQEVRFDFQIFDPSSELVRAWEIEDPFDETWPV